MAYFGRNMFMTPLEAQNRNPSCKTKKIKLVAKTKTFQRNGKKKLQLAKFRSLFQDRICRGKVNLINQNFGFWD